MYLIHSLFTTDPNGHGGEKRSAQIVQILSENSIYPIFLNNTAKALHWNRFQKIFASFPFARKLGIPLWDLRGLTRLGGGILHFKGIFTSYSKNSVLLWESTHPKMFSLPILAKRAGLKIIALPHNLESLVPGQSSYLSGKIAPHWFEEEIKALSFCDSVITISREDQWLLRLYGINADYLPYFPPEKALVLLKEIRNKRSKGKNNKNVKKLLALGTIGNTPTRLGIIEMIREINLFINREGVNIELHIVGYGSELLINYIPISNSIVLHGSLPTKALSNLLIDMDAVIVHQFPTTGCLTRISEMLIAGLPIISNINAARSWERWRGVHIYETWDELNSLLQSDFQIPTTPQRPINHEQHFLSILNMLSNGKK